MFKFLTLVFLSISLNSLAFGQVSLTFSVDMSSSDFFNPALHQVYVSGARQGGTQGIGALPVWPMPGSQQGFLMSQSASNTNIYELTINNVSVGTYEYKYFLVANNQSTWNLGEWSGTNNRVFVVGNQNLSTSDFWGITPNGEVNLKINEIMASNGSILADEDGDFEDWIEIYNAGVEAVNMYGFGLTDNPNMPMKWTFPSVFILPNQYLLVWASGKNRKSLAQPPHTNFSISNSGETIQLSDQNGQFLDSIPSAMHQNNIAYGRFPNGSETMAYLSNPTPDAVNEGPSYNSLSAPLQFSQSEGYYQNPVVVGISSPDNNTVIRYTLDGSEPTENSPIYTSPFTFQNRSDEPNEISQIPTNNAAVGSPYFEGWQPPVGNVYKINVLRAKAYNPSTPEAPSFTGTYIVDNALHSRFSLPVISLTSDFSNLFDPETGMYVFGTSGNYWQDWERSCNFTMFLKNGTLAFNQNAGFQLNGNTTRSRPRKSIRMIFRGEYGESWLNYPIFENKETQKYKRLILRNGGNDWGNTLIRDGLAQILAKDFKVEIQYFQPSILFINGEYWGLHNLRDRYSTHYFEAKYGIIENSLTVMENNATFKRGNPVGAAHYQNLINFIQNNNLSNAQNYAQVTEKMDVESFIDFQLANIYAKNTDWPGNNNIYWRYIRDDFDPNEGVYDGRWRWVLFDLDFGFDLNFVYVPFINEGAAHNTLEFALQTSGLNWPNPDWSTLMLRKLVQNTDFKNKFVNRYCDLLNTVYKSEFVQQTIDSISNILAPEMEEHIARWRMPESLNSWSQEIDGIKNFVQQRADYQFVHLQSSFGLGEKHEVTINVDFPDAGFVKLNTIELTPQTNGISEVVYPWQGFYLNGAPILLTAIAKPGYVFSHWSGDISNGNKTITVNLEQNINVTAHFIPINQSDFELLHFWFFGNTLANNSPLSTIDPTFLTHHASMYYSSCLLGYPFQEGHPNWRKASLERRNSPTPINYIPQGNDSISFVSANMRGIQVRQPLRNQDTENTLFLQFSSQGFKDIQLLFAAKDEGAAQGLIVDFKNPKLSDEFFSIENTNEINLTHDFQVFQFNLSELSASNNADTLIARIRFHSMYPFADNGDRVTFNNFSILGKAIPDETTQPESATEFFYFYPNPASDFISWQASDDVVRIQIYNLSGALVLDVKSLDNNTLDISGLANGVFSLRATLANGILFEKKLVRIK